nr:MAG TPA_asm: hypothetical protein [Caudoviricetes sp.]
MAETVYLLDGTMEVVLTEKDVFIDRLVREKLGDDAARFISDYIEEIADDAKCTEEARQDAEKTADGYLALCQCALAALSELKDLTHEARLDRAKIQKSVDSAHRELCHNL